MRKYSVVAMFMLCFCSSASANGNLRTLIIELENVKGLVAQQQRKAEDNGSRWVFRYDILEQRIESLITDIKKHIAVTEQTPKLERFTQ